MAEPFILGRRLYTDASRSLILEDGDTRAAYLIGGAGSPVYPEDVEHYGLDDSHRLIESPPEAESEQASEPAEDRTITAEKFEPESSRRKRIVKSR